MGLGRIVELGIGGLCRTRQRWVAPFPAVSLEPDGTLTGLTAVGRATVTCLKINRPLAVQIRVEEALRGRYP